MSFSTDHRLVWAHLRTEYTPSTRTGVQAPRDWQPASTWAATADQLAWDWADWDNTSSLWCETAKDHGQRKRVLKDEVLRELLDKHALASPVENDA